MKYRRESVMQGIKELFGTFFAFRRHRGRGRSLNQSRRAKARLGASVRRT